MHQITSGEDGSRFLLFRMLLDFRY